MHIMQEHSTGLAGQQQRRDIEHTARDYVLNSTYMLLQTVQHGDTVRSVVTDLLQQILM